MPQESQDLEAQNRMIGSQLRRKRAEVSENKKKTWPHNANPSQVTLA